MHACEELLGRDEHIWSYFDFDIVVLPPGAGDGRLPPLGQLSINIPF